MKLQKFLHQVVNRHVMKTMYQELSGSALLEPWLVTVSIFRSVFGLCVIFCVVNIDLPLSSPSFDHVVSDFGSESFKNILGQQFE